MSHDTVPISELAPSERIRLTELAKTLAPFAEKARKPVPNYRGLYNAIVSGQIEAERIGREWFVRKSSTDKVAGQFGLVPVSSVETAHRALADAAAA